MGILDGIIQGVGNQLKWKAQNEAAAGVEKGIGAVLQRFKGKCPKCKKPVTEIGAKFCPHCQAKLVLICPNPNCRREASLDTQFCASCGTDLLKAGKPTEVNPSTEAESSEAK